MKKQKNIFVKIGTLSNKGDMLMLLAILQRYQEFSMIAIEPQDNLEVDFIKRNRIMYCRPNKFKSTNKKFSSFQEIKSIILTIWNMMPSSILNKLNYISSHKVDLYLDASGFAYGDTWGYEKTNKGLSYLDSFSNIKTVFMPQSFGTFQEEGMKELLKKLINKADIILARDSKSYENLTKNLTIYKEKVFQFPDFTFDVEKIQPNEVDIVKKYVIIIPSHRVKDNDKTGQYTNFLVKAINIILTLDYEVVFLLHDSTHDKKVAHEISKALNKKLTVIEKSDVRELRWVISKSDLVISSRFHGLVNSLTQNVPVLGIGWTHKFDRLMNEYGIPGFLLEPTIDTETLKTLIKNLLLGKTREEIIQTIKENRNIQYNNSKEMWTMIDEFIVNKPLK